VDVMATIDRQTLAEVCHRWHIDRLALFGSVARGEERPDSDLDLLVVFDEGRNPGLEFVDVEDELSALFGRTVDLRTPGDLSRYFRSKVVAEAVVLYEREGQSPAPAHA
jgi:predicted nucleotidyltransferase